MTFHNTEIEGLVIIETKKFFDDRGYFFESFQQEKFDHFIGTKTIFVQENESCSSLNVVRGLHFQNNPNAQGKLVRVISGSVFDVAVDIRKKSPTYGQWFGLELTEQNKWMMYIPEGFAHGFATLQDFTVFSYKCTNFYNKASEDCIFWNDSDLAINWPIENPILSDKDLLGKHMKDFNSLF